MTKLNKSFLIIGILFIFFISIAVKSIAIVGAGERGVVLTWGAVSDIVLDEGIHFIIPIMQTVKILDVKTQKEEVEVLAYSKDIQTVQTSIALNYHVYPDTVNKLWQELGPYYVYNIIDPAIQESVKAATAQFTAQELIEKRPELKEEIKEQLKDRLGEKYIFVDDFSIVNFDFSDAYENAVEEKQVAQQKSLKAKNDLERIKIEAEQKIAEAQAEAESIRIQANALKQNNDLIQLKAVEKWNGQLPYYMLGDAVPFISINK